MLAGRISSPGWSPYACFSSFESLLVLLLAVRENVTTTLEVPSGKEAGRGGWGRMGLPAGQWAQSPASATVQPLVVAAEAMADRGYGNPALYGKLKAAGPFNRGSLSTFSLLLTVCCLDLIFFYCHIPTSFSSENFLDLMLPCWKNTHQPLD